MYVLCNSFALARNEYKNKPPNINLLNVTLLLEVCYEIIFENHTG